MAREKPQWKPTKLLKPTELWKPTGVSFSSGGIHGNAMTGVLANLVDNDMLGAVTDWYGCSCGTIPALAGAVGVDSSAWLRDTALCVNFNSLTMLSDTCITDVTQRWGLIPNQRLLDIFGKMFDTWEAGLSTITFAELAARRPVRLHIIATNITRRCQVVFNVANSPHMRVIDAVVASCAVPLYFTPWTAPSGEIFCDGAMSEYYPWRCVTDKARTLVVAGYDTLISGEGRFDPVTSLNEYMYSLIRMLQKNKSVVRPLNWIALNITAIDGLDFAIPTEDRIALFNQGYRAAEAWTKFTTCSHRKTDEVPPQCVHLRTSPSLAHSRTKTSDIPLHHTLAPCQDSRGPQYTGSGRGRRWSL